MVFVCLWSLAVFGWFAHGIDRVPFHPDEMSWIVMSGDVDAIASLEWSRLIWHRDQDLDADLGYRLLNPPLAKYVIGVGRRLAGTQTSITDWDWRATREENVVRGALPPDDLLRAARLASAAAGALSIGVFAWIAWRASGWLAAVVASLLLATDPLELLHVRRAMAEGSAQLFQLLAVLAILDVALRRQRRIGATLAFGVAVACAIAAKLHFAALAPLAIVVAALRWMPASESWWHRAAMATVGAAVTGTTIAATFFLLNPVMYAQPLHAAHVMWLMRSQMVGMQSGSQDSLEQRLPTIPARIVAAVKTATWALPEPNEWARFAPPDATDPRGDWLDALWRTRTWRALFAFAAAAGAIAMIVRLRHEWAQRSVGPATIVLLWIAAQLVFCALFVPLNWQRYFVPLVPPACLLAGEAVSTARRRVSR